MKSRRDLYTLLTSRLDSCIITIYNIISTRIMYEELDLDYSINNLDEEYAYTYDLDEEYARKQTSFQELAYMHYA